MTISPDLWPRVKAVVEAALDATPAERDRVVQSLAQGDEAVKAAATRLLAAADLEGGVLDGLAIDAVSGAAEDGAAFSLTGRTLGPWRVGEEIGRGGMGVVYEGRRVDDAFTRRVAIKTLAMGLGSPDLVWRFRRERQILAALDHPNIAQLLDGGATPEGVPWLVMEHVTGERIDQWCAARRLTIPQRLDLFRQVCSAVQFAHTRLVVHRDLKPGNILVTPEGVVKLLDFGVAKLLSPDGPSPGDDTRSRAAPMTLAFASPEQVRGEVVATTTDVYALGALLFVLLTGRPPFALEQHTPADALALVTSEPARAPSSAVTADQATACGAASVGALRRTLAGELDDIVLMALRKEPTRRYPSVEALADDVHRFLRGDPVRARPDTWGYRTRKFVRRQRALVAGLAVAATGLAVGTLLSAWQARRAGEAARRAQGIASFLQQVVGAGDLGGQAFGAPRLGPGASIAEMLDSAAAWAPRALGGDPEVRALLHGMVANALMGQERYTEALAQFDSAVAVGASGSRWSSMVAASALESRAALRLLFGRVAQADSDAQAAVSRFRAEGDTTSWMYGNALLRLAHVAVGRGDLPGARGAASHTLASATGTDSGSILLRARTLAFLGFLQSQSAPTDDSTRATLRRALATFDSLGAVATREEAELMLTVIGVPGLVTRGQADSLAREALGTNERAAGPNSSAVATTLWVLAARQRALGDPEGQRRYIDRAMQIVARRPDLPATVRQYVYMEYARRLWLANQLDSAVTLARRVLGERRGGPPALAGESAQLVGALLVVRGRDHGGGVRDFVAADSVLTESYSLLRSVFPAEGYWPQTAAGTLVSLYAAWHQPAKLEWALAQLTESERTSRRAALARGAPDRTR